MVVKLFAFAASAILGVAASIAAILLWHPACDASTAEHDSPAARVGGVTSVSGDPGGSKTLADSNSGFEDQPHELVAVATGSGGTLRSLNRCTRAKPANPALCEAIPSVNAGNVAPPLGPLSDRRKFAPSSLPQRRYTNQPIRQSSAQASPWEPIVAMQMTQLMRQMDENSRLQQQSLDRALSALERRQTSRLAQVVEPLPQPNTNANSNSARHPTLRHPLAISARFR